MSRRVEEELREQVHELVMRQQHLEHPHLGERAGSASRVHEVQEEPYEDLLGKLVSSLGLFQSLSTSVTGAERGDHARTLTGPLLP